MSAALLREAATKMRERAEAATPGPWRVGAEGSEGSRVNPATGDKREDSHWIASVNGRVQPEDGRNAEHIASWHPAIALAVADLIDELLRSLSVFGEPADDDPLWQKPTASTVVRLSRAYLGNDR